MNNRSQNTKGGKELIQKLIENLEWMDWYYKMKYNIRPKLVKMFLKKSRQKELEKIGKKFKRNLGDVVRMLAKE